VTVDVTSYATICRPAFRAANVLFFHYHENHCFYSHARTAVIFITLMVGNLKSCSSSGPWWNNAHAEFRENTLYACFSIWTNIFLCTLPLNRANTRNVDPFQCKAAQKLPGTEIKAKRILVSYTIKVSISCYFSFQLLPPVVQLWKMATQVNTGKCVLWYHDQNR
jgi:hypothetical protein